jgi:hypothetical protein
VTAVNFSDKCYLQNVGQIKIVVAGHTVGGAQQGREMTKKALWDGQLRARGERIP